MHYCVSEHQKSLGLHMRLGIFILTQIMRTFFILKDVTSLKLLLLISSLQTLMALLSTVYLSLWSLSGLSHISSHIF